MSNPIPGVYVQQGFEVRVGDDINPGDLVMFTADWCNLYNGLAYASDIKVAKSPGIVIAKLLHSSGVAVVVMDATGTLFQEPPRRVRRL